MVFTSARYWSLPKCAIIKNVIGNDYKNVSKEIYKMKKRIMGIVLTAVMLAAVLSGCGNSTAVPAASTAPSAAPAAAESAAPAEKLSGSVSTDGSVMDSLGNEAKENKVSLELCGGPAYV